MQEKIDAIIEKIQNNQLKEADALFDALMSVLVDENEIVIAQTGYTFAQLGLVDKARAIYELGRTNFPNSQKWALLEGELLIDDGQPESALDLLLLIPEEADEYLDALLLESDAYQLLGLPEVSLAKLNEAREIDPEQVAITYGIAELKFDQGDFNGLEPLYEELLETDTLTNQQRQMIQDHYSYALAWNGDIEAAAALIEKIPENDQSVEQKEQLALYYYQLENFEKAQTVFERLYENAELATEFLPLYAQVKQYYHEYETAKEILEVAIDKNPFQAPLLVQKATIDEKLGNVDTAFDLLESAIDLDPEYNEARLRMLRIANTAKRFGYAKQLILNFDQEDFEDPNYDWMKAKTFQGLEAYTEAGQYYEAAFSQLYTNISFMEDYLAYLQEMGAWQKIDAIFKNHHFLMHAPELQTIIDSYLTWKNDYDEQ